MTALFNAELDALIRAAFPDDDWSSVPLFPPVDDALSTPTRKRKRQEASSSSSSSSSITVNDDSKRNCYIVRISARNKKATADYSRLLESDTKTWDEVSPSSDIKTGDLFGFIVGDHHMKASVELYEVKEVLTVQDRLVQWNGPYDPRRKHPGNRRAIAMIRRSDIDLSWAMYKKSAGYKDSYCPCGATKAANPF